MRKADLVGSQYRTGLASIHITKLLNISGTCAFPPCLSLKSIFMDITTIFCLTSSDKMKPHLHQLSIQRQLCGPNNMCFKFTLSLIGFRSKNLQIQPARPTISHWHSLLSAGSGVCLLYGCRRLHLHISFVFWHRLMCCDAAPSVMWIWMGCVQRLPCQGEKDPDWQGDDLSLSQTNPFQISPRITPAHQFLFLEWLDSEMVIAF